MSDAELDSFLALFGSSGTLDSTADLTLNTLKARQKISQSQLPKEGLWLVKLVQAAVSIGAEKAQIVFGRREIDFRFEVEEWPWEPRQVLQDFLSGVLPTEPCLFHLFAGLRNSLYEDTVSARWIIRTSEKVFTASFDADGTEFSEKPGDGQAGFRLVTTRPPRWPGLKRASTTPVKHLIRRTADEFLAVHSYCWPCPIPLNVDGRPLENRYVPSVPIQGDAGFVQQAMGASHLSTYKVRPALLAKRPLSGELELYLPWPEDPGEVELVQLSEQTVSLKKRTYFGQTWMEYESPESSAPGCYLLLLFGAQMESRVEFLCDGVVVDMHELPWASGKLTVLGKEVPVNQFKVSVRVLLPVESSRLDLSHFRVREKEKILALWEPRIRAALKETCEAVLQNAGKFKPDFANQPTNLLNRVWAEYFRILATVHPIFYYLTRHGFRKEVKSLLESLTAE